MSRTSTGTNEVPLWQDRLRELGDRVPTRWLRPGAGTLGIANWCSAPGSAMWIDAESVKIAFACWGAMTRRVANDLPSRIRSTSCTIGAAGSPGRRR
jgi:hypothetical protein